MQIVNVHLCRTSRASVFTSARRWNPLITAGIATEMALMLAIAYTPLGNAIFSTASIDAVAWLFMVPFAAAMLAGEELRKWIVRSDERRAGRSDQLMYQPPLTLIVCPVM
jgi:hypothetical protein